MGLLTNLRAGEQTGLELRSYWTGPITSRSPELARLWSGGDSYTGVPVNEHTALNYSAYWTAVSLIASDVASLPLILYKREKGGGKSRYVDAKLYQLLHDEPNPEMSSVVFRETLQAHALTWGNGYAEIERDGAGKVVALWPITPNRVSPFRNVSGTLRYRIMNESGGETIIDRNDVLHIPGLGFDGTIGYSIVAKARESIGLGLATERFGATFFGNGATFGGVLEHPGVMSDKAGKNFRETIAARHQGVNRAHQLLLLEEGMKYQQLGIPPNDSQWIESRKFQIEEIARWFRLPPHKIGSMDRATFCLPGDAEVYTDEGPRPIAEVRAGDLVWSWTGDQWRLSQVAKSSCTGYDEILTISTTNRRIRLNGKHRVLARRRVLKPATMSRGGVVSEHGWQRVEWEDAYVPASELVEGDTIIVPTRLPMGETVSRTAPNGRSLTVGFMEVCGLLAGDGNIAMTANGEPRGLQFARADHASYMDAYREALRRGFTKANGGEIRLVEGGRQTRFSSAAAGREMAVLGFGGTAKTKRVPGWIFQLDPDLRVAYVRGFLDADGSVDKKGRVSFSSSNRVLLSQVRHLCIGLGIPVTNQSHRTGTTKLPNGRLAEFSQHYFTCSDPGANRAIGSHTPDYVRRMEGGQPFGRKGRAYPRHGGAGMDMGQISLTRIAKIEKGRVLEPVYDLCVEGTHSFIADGVVVHNSNIEHQTLDYVRSCLRGWLVRWEQEINRKLISPLERKIQFVEHNLEGLLRGDSAARGEFYRTMYNIGAFSVNMILERENENGIGADGDVHMAPMNMVPLNRLSEVIDAQIAPKTVTAPVTPPAEPKPTRELAMLNELFAAAVTRAEAHLAQAVAADAREAHTAAEKAQAVAERDAARQKFQTAQAEADALRAEIVLTEQRLVREKDEAETRHAEGVATAQRAADAQIADLVGQMASLEARSEEQTAATTRAHDELVAQRDALAVVQSALVKADADKDALTVEGRTRIVEWTALEVTLRAEAQGAESWLALANEELASTKREIEAGQAAMAQMRIEQDATLATRAGVEQGLAEQIATLQEVADALRARTKEKEDAIAQAEADLVTVRALVESTAADLAVAHAEKDASVVLAAEHEARGRELERQIAEIQAETRAKEAEASDLATALATAEALSAATAADLAVETLEKDNAAAQVVEIQARVADLDNTVAALYAETQTKAEALATSTTALAVAQALAESTAATLVAVQAERDAATTEADHRRVDLERQIVALHAETETKERAAADLAEALGAAEARSAVTAEALADATRTNDAATAQMMALQARSDALDSRVADLDADTRAKGDTLATVAAELAAAQALAESATTTLAAVEAERDATATQATTQRVELERQLADLQAETRSKEDAAAKAVADLMTLRTVADATHTDLEAAATARDAALAQIGDLIGKAQDLEVQLAELHAEAARQEQVAAEAQAASRAAEQRAEQTVQDRAAAFVTAQRNKEADRLSAMLTAHRALMVDTLSRMVRRETEKARRHQATIPKLRAWMESFYPMFEDSCVEALTPVLRAHLAWMQSGADPGAEALTIARAYIADSRRQLSVLLDTQPDDLHGSLERLLLRWEQKRPDAVADRLVEEGVAYVRSFR